MSNTVCSSLKYQLSEFSSVMQKNNPNPSKDLESQELKFYIVSPSQVLDPSTLVGRIRILLDKLWKWLTSNNYQGTLQEPVDNIIHKLFDQVIKEAYEARQSYLANQIRLIETSFDLVTDNEVKAAQKQRYYSHLQTELGRSNAHLGGLAANFDSALQQTEVLSDTAVDALRHVVTNVSQAVEPFWSKMLHYKTTFASSLNPYIPNEPPKATEENPIDWAIANSSLYRALSKEQSRIDLEGLMQQPIPVIELIKICDPNQALLESERRRLEKWIKELNGLSNKLRDKRMDVTAAHLLKNALEELVRAISIQGRFQISVGLLINKLDDNDCTLMREEDSNHVAWRRKLKKGEVIRCEGVEYRLGDELVVEEPPAVGQSLGERYKKRKLNRHRVFEVQSTKEQNAEEQNGSRLVVKIGSSPFDLLIGSHRFAEFHCAIPGIKGVGEIKLTDDKRPVLFLERLPIHLSNYQWTSNQSRLDEQDEMILSRICSFLYCMFDWKKWVEGATIKRLGVDSADILTSLSWLEGVEDDYLAAEDFCVEAATKMGSFNPHALRYMMEVSGYSTHRMFEFYREKVTTMLKTGDLDLLNLSLPDGFNKPEYLKKIPPLLDQAQVLRTACLEEVVKSIDEKENFLKSRKALLVRKSLQLNAKEALVLDEGRGAFEREKNRLKREMGELKDQKAAMRESIHREFLGYMRNWQHFDVDKDRLVKKLSDNGKELKNINLELGNASKEQRHNLSIIKKDLKTEEGEVLTEIITLSVYDRLLEAYLDLPTSSWLPDSLFETVVNSFKSGSRGIERTVIDYNYYKEQQDLIIAKNLYAIELMKQKQGDLAL